MAISCDCHRPLDTGRVYPPGGTHRVHAASSGKAGKSVRTEGDALEFRRLRGFCRACNGDANGVTLGEDLRTFGPRIFFGGTPQAVRGRRW